ncbi:MAG: dGTP triphosphohydrolase [Candidatus Methylacidiphilales bacterium]|nr:dNTP triphosphohydrolase [Candidatus Methylacidiphilales bacterium]
MSVNMFYNAFDRECFSDDYNYPRGATDHRTVFQQDRDRVMFTSAFRRLQGKTQVFRAGEYDFYRTRLTHSLEVANIAASICAYLKSSSPHFEEDFYIDPQLVEAACLSHDIGHPPFGHSGERALNDWMQPYGGFEGNAQSLRILSRTIYGSGEERKGMSPSRALIDSILKYKRLFRDRGDDQNHFLYDQQSSFLIYCFGRDDIAGALDDVDATPDDANKFRSIECQIMDAADDIAYSCCDLVDGVKARFITTDRLSQWGESQAGTMTPVKAEKLDKLIGRIRDRRLEPAIGKVMGEFIHACTLLETDNFMSLRTNRYRFDLEMDPSKREEIALYKDISRIFVFGSSELHHIEFKGIDMLRRMIGVWTDLYLSDTSTKGRMRLLPGPVHELILAQEEVAERARIICDYISGMTDAYAVKMYKRLFDPDYGSITELM